MNIKHLFVASAALLAMAACSSDDRQAPGEQTQYPIRLSNNLVAPGDATRATGNYAAGFIAGSEFWVWADMTDEGESDVRFRIKEFIPAWKLTVNAADASTFDTETTQTFPVYNKLSFYAMHGNFSSTFTAGQSSFPGVLTHSVMTTQQSDGDYLASDLVYAVKADVTPTASVVPLEFYHMLTKIEVALKAGNQMTEAALKTVDDTKVTVSILGTKTQVQFRPSKSTDHVPSTLEGRAYMLTIPEAAVAQPITLSTVTTDDFTDGTCAAAIVVPQTVDGRFIRLSYMGHDTYYSVSNLELKSGYRYRFNLTVDRIGEEFFVTPSLTVSPWGADTDVPADLKNITGTTERN